ncbi:YsnF/AvaK domain-containing protein [Hymenobacter cellulosivorans]|uniref:YsnF/AvaK domain-containing protein n=1 Tax=Hymenobacter cellulosivorans TaxID=2932249 RepID=A0ABY4FEY0_9BACT|nr:YsnF/AvaK domain-containing protein [Hymenobacter cellulosivorans]UOQ53006.1 YsnF/AvaK domain-containing protein [Hymenobacter cellulosivorans]
MEPNRPSITPSETLRPATAATGQPLVIPVIEEQAVINREVVESGRVRLAKTVHEREEMLEIPLQHEEVLVERVPVNQFVADGAATPGLRYDGDTTIIPVLREVVVTRLLVVEEIRVTKRTQTTTLTQPITLRHEEIRVDRSSGTEATSAAPGGPPTQ